MDDISGQTLIGEDLQESEEDHGLIMNSLNNQSGGVSDAALGQGIGEFEPAGQALALNEKYRQTGSSGRPQQQEALESMPSGRGLFSNIGHSIHGGREDVAGDLSDSTDVTDWAQAEETRLELESLVRNSQRLEAIGMLAGGIAHDFNNVLSAIIGYAELAMMDVADGSPMRHIMEQIVKAGLRGRDLIQQILSFSRRTEQKAAPLHLSHVVKEAVKFMRASLPSTIELKYNIDPEEEAVLVDPTQIHQVLMNLGANAAYAMRESGGTLEITLCNTSVDEETARVCVDLITGNYQELTVKDTGCGIDPQVLDRIFDPYFTTKPLGEGTGLGLSTTHGIVKNLGGAIRVHSVTGQGTTFRIYLPCIKAEVIPDASRALVPAATGTERILLVDDEVSLVDVSRKMLGRLGYVVTGMNSGVEALRAFHQDPDRFDLVITDQTMPGMTGVELSREILKMRPDLPIILFTGYSQQVDRPAAMAMGIRHFILKPFILQEIVKAIRDLFDRAHTDVI
jgi:signal transduction histidine kinase/CheY-like chemotaxis protein